MQAIQKIIDRLYNIYIRFISKIKLFIYDKLNIEDKINEQKKLTDELSDSIKNINDSINKIEEFLQNKEHNF
jgi:hypothetical protein